jgi:predicted amidophosphoribosyltransferase
MFLISFVSFVSLPSCPSWFSFSLVTCKPRRVGRIPLHQQAHAVPREAPCQALEIARVVAARTGIPLLPLTCRELVETPPQAALPWKGRAKNVRRAFVCDADLRGKRIAVVLTTRATLNELGRAPRKAGAAQVAGWVVART